MDGAHLSPEAAGLDPERVAEVVARAQREVDAGAIGSCQLAIARHGRLGAVVSLGSVRRGGRTEVATNDTLYVAFSCNKAIMAAATWLLIQEGRLDPAERVGDVVPEFDTNGKHVVTVEHLLCHTAGFPTAPYPPAEWHDRDKRLERFARWRRQWEPGSRYEYHPTSSMWVVAELIDRRAGIDYRVFVRDRIAGPLGLGDFHLGAPPDVHDRIADIEYRGEEPDAAELEAAGWPELPPIDPQVGEMAILGFNHAFVRQAGLPGGGAITTAATLALFYQALLAGGHASDGTEIWSSSTLAEARRIRTGTLTDPLFGARANRGLGVVVAGDEQRTLRGFGYTNSAETFGHNGAGGQIAWGDPVTGISFAFLTNSFDRNPIRQGRRGIGLSSRAAACGT